jgi:hypothetical protein
MRTRSDPRELRLFVLSENEMQPIRSDRRCKPATFGRYAYAVAARAKHAQVFSPTSGADRSAAASDLAFALRRARCGALGVGALFHGASISRGASVARASRAW